MLKWSCYYPLNTYAFACLIFGFYVKAKGCKEDICMCIEVGFQKHNEKCSSLEGVLAVMVH